MCVRYLSAMPIIQSLTSGLTSTEGHISNSSLDIRKGMTAVHSATTLRSIVSMMPQCSSGCFTYDVMKAGLLPHPGSISGPSV
jgi:hypothetical protein